MNDSTDLGERIKKVIKLQERDDEKAATPLDFGKFLKEHLPNIPEAERKEITDDLYRGLNFYQTPNQRTIVDAFIEIVPTFSDNGTRLHFYLNTVDRAKEFSRRVLESASTLPDNYKDQLTDRLQYLHADCTREIKRYNLRFGNFSTLKREETTAGSSYRAKKKQVTKGYEPELDVLNKTEDRYKESVSNFARFGMTYQKAMKMDEDKLEPEAKTELEGLQKLRDGINSSRDNIERAIDRETRPEYNAWTKLKQSVENWSSEIEKSTYLEALMQTISTGN